MIGLATPDWLNKKKEIRIKDLDNLVKALVDAAQLAFGFRDEQIFTILSFKLLTSKVEYTEIYLYDAGCNVEMINK